jgi:hypothetical protein
LFGHFHEQGDGLAGIEVELLHQQRRGVMDHIGAPVPA